jgi:hypothetical protein
VPRGYRGEARGEGRRVRVRGRCRRPELRGVWSTVKPYLSRKGGVFSEHSCSLRTCPAHPIRAHTCSAITRRLCGWLGASGTQDLRALGLWQSCRQWRAQPWSCMDAAPGCRLQRRSSANILTAWPGRVAQAPRACRARTPWSSSPCWRPSSRTARFGDQLGLDDEANSQIADGGATGSRLRGGTSVGDLPTSSVSAVQLIPETVCSAPTAPVF